MYGEQGREETVLGLELCPGELLPARSKSSKRSRLQWEMSVPCGWDPQSKGSPSHSELGETEI